MTSVVDPILTMVNIFKDNWISLNTDDNIPEVLKITDTKRYDYSKNYDVILVHRSRKSQEPAGIGSSVKRFVETLDIDIRTLGWEREEHWRRVTEEVDRILDGKLILLDGNYDILDSDDEAQDLSDKTTGQWRIVRTIRLTDLVKARGTI